MNVRSALKKLDAGAHRILCYLPDEDEEPLRVRAYDTYRKRLLMALSMAGFSRIRGHVKEPALDASGPYLEEVALWSRTRAGKEAAELLRGP